jgi:transcriptional regulator with XRE-family HTH domain
VAVNNIYIQQIQFLNYAVKSKNITLKLISDSTGVHISQVSRIITGKSKRLSPNVDKICKFANKLSSPISPQESEKILYESILGIWDGTSEHALALKALLQEIGRYQKAATSAAQSTKET